MDKNGEMTLEIWLTILAIGLPLAGALLIWWLGDEHRRTKHWLSVIVATLTGLIALGLFFTNRHFACMLLSGRQNCIWNGFATLSLGAAGLGLALKTQRARMPGYSNRSRNDVPLLLLVGGWAAMGLAENLLLWFVGWWLLLYGIYRWLTTKGLVWRIIVIRDDYKDDRHR